METIREVIERIVAEAGGQMVDLDVLNAHLVAREEAMADVLRLAGAQFGLYPQIVAKVLADVGLGEPISDEQKAFVNQQFVALMEELQRQFGQGNQ